jgi:hypothetical protein
LLKISFGPQKLLESSYPELIGTGTNSFWSLKPAMGLFFYQESEAKCDQLRREAAAAERREQAATAALTAKEGEVTKLLEEIHTGAQLLHQV